MLKNETYTIRTFLPYFFNPERIKLVIHNKVLTRSISERGAKIESEHHYPVDCFKMKGQKGGEFSRIRFRMQLYLLIIPEIRNHKNSGYDQENGNFLLE